MQLGLRALDLFSRRLVERRVVGDVPHVLGDADESPAHMQIVDGPAIVLGVDDRHGRAGEPGDILSAAGLLQRLVVLEECLERHRGRDFPAPDHVQHGGIDAAVHRQEEVFRLEEGGDQMDGFVVDQQRPEKRLLGLKVARRRPGPLLDLLAGATVAHSAACMARRTASALPMRMSAVISPRPHRTSWLSCRWRRSASWSTS